MARNRKDNLCVEAHKSAAYKSTDKPLAYFVMVKLDGSEPEDVVTGEDGREYMKTEHIPFDLDSVPDCVRDDLARATLDFIKQCDPNPGQQKNRQ